MPDVSQPPSEPDPAYEPTRMASSDHPSGDTWRLQQTPARTAGSVPPGGALPAAEVIGDFEIVGKLGQGGMGTVYRARQRSLDRLVALKILPTKLEADAEFVARFQREARVAANLAHANLVRVYTSGSAAGCHYIAMELIEGETLADWLKRGPVPPLQAVRITLDVTHALECGWRTAQLIHRDIKPGNIFLSREGAVKLGDLGLAKTIGSDTTGLTQTGAMMGTPHYISPEQARGDRDLDFRADIYSLGCTLYQMLTGRTPYDGRDPFAVMNMHVNAPPPAILKVLPQCPIPLARLVSKMLKKQRRERHASYEELIAQLESVQAVLDPARMAPALAATAAAPVEVGTSRRGVQSEATQSTDTEGRRGTPTLPAKSKLPLYAGIAAGVLALGIAGYFLWPKEEKLTAAQRWSREHTGDKKAETESPPATPGGTRSVASMGAGPGPMPIITGWQDVMDRTKEQLRKVSKAEFTEENGWVATTTKSGSGFQIYPKKVTDIAFRGKLRGQVNIFLRDAPPAGKFNVRFKPVGSGYVERNDRIAGQPGQSTNTTLQAFRMSAVPEHEFLIVMIGQELRVWVDGKLVATVHDAAHPSGAPGVALDEAGAAVRDLAVADLAAAPAHASPADAVNLLSLVDLKRDATVGTWSMTPEGLAIQHDGKVDRLEFNFVPSAEYDFAVEFTPQSGADVAQLFPLPDRGIMWRTLPPAPFGPMLDGLKPTDTKRTEGVTRGLGRFAAGKRYRSVIEVRTTSLRALLDGEEVLKFTGDLKRFSGDDMFKLRDAQHLGVAGYNTDILFHKAEVWPAGASASAAPAAAVGAASSEIFLFGDHRYQFVPGKITWAAAKARAESMGGHLATINSKEEDEWLMRTFKPYAFASNANVHLGGVLEGTQWKWITGEPFTYTGWAPGEPDGHNDSHTLQFWNRGGTLIWDDRRDSLPDEDVAGFIVEWDNVGAPAAKFSPSTEPWVDALADPAAVVLNNHAKRTTGGLELGDRICGVTIKPVQGPDCAVRMLVQTGNKVHAPWIFLRHTRGPGFNTGYYFALRGSSNSVLIGQYEANKFKEMKIFPVKPLMPGEMYELEGRVVGNKITVKLDGVEAGLVEDDSIREGGATIEATQVRAKFFFCAACNISTCRRLDRAGNHD